MPIGTYMSEIKALKFTLNSVKLFNIVRVGYTYPLLVNGAAAKIPPNSLKIRMEAVFFERAQPIWKAVYTKNVPIKIGLRPYCYKLGKHKFQTKLRHVPYLLRQRSPK